MGFDVDEAVWLTQEDVAKGEDTVVKRAMEWIRNLVYAHDVMVDKTYFRPGLDSVMISAKVENPNNHNLEVTAYISVGKDSLIDSLSLSSMSGTENNYWQASYFADSGKENTFFVDVKTEDFEDSTMRKISDVAWFTSIGPVKLVDTTHVEETYSARHRSQYF